MMLKVKSFNISPLHIGTVLVLAVLLLGFGLLLLDQTARSTLEQALPFPGYFWSSSTTENSERYQTIVTDRGECSYSFPSPRSPLASSSNSHHLAKIDSRNPFALPLYPYYLTSIPSRDSGVSKSFLQWFLGIYIANEYNLTYIYTDPLPSHPVWSRFLGLDFGETKEIDIKIRHDEFEMHETPYIRNYEGLTINKFGTNVYPILLQERKILDRNGIENEEQLKHQVSIARPYYVTLRNAQPSDSDALLTCLEPFHTILSRKYCTARVLRPHIIDLYDNERAKGNINVAIHLYCVGECVKSEENVGFYVDGMALLIRNLHQQLLKAKDLNSDEIEFKGITFHLFPHQPLNLTQGEGVEEDEGEGDGSWRNEGRSSDEEDGDGDTNLDDDTASAKSAAEAVAAESNKVDFRRNPYSGLLSHRHLHSIRVVSHFEFPSIASFHHYVTADVFVGAHNGVSLLALLMRPSFSLTAFPMCSNHLVYDPVTGQFEDHLFRKMYKQFHVKRMNQHHAMSECEKIQFDKPATDSRRSKAITPN